MIAYALVAAGGALGSVGRFWLAMAVGRLTGPEFPWGTILINILGSFVIGWFGALTATDGRFPASADTRAFVMAGICGGFTTFSAFSLQTVELLRAGQGLRALANVAVSVLVCLAATALGLILARH
jgi:CrcB protein